LIRRARPDEATTLSELAFQSKAHWDFSVEFMEAPLARRAALAPEHAQ